MAMPLLLATLALMVGGCGSPPPSEPADTEVLGPVNRAFAGAPLQLGLISNGKGVALDMTAEIDGVRAAVGYINNHLGGINGRPVELSVCETRSVPAQAVGCANEFASAKVAAVVSGGLGEIDQVVPILSAAKIPYFNAIAASELALTTPGIYSMTNGVSIFSTSATYARQQRFKRAALVVIDVPQATGAATTVGSMIYRRAGVESQVVAIAPGTADMTPQLQSADRSHPQLYVVIGDPSFCTSAIKALRALGIDSSIAVADGCVSKDMGAAVPGGSTVVKAIASFKLDHADPEFQIFSTALNAYGSGTQPSALSAMGYSAMLGLARALNAATTTDMSSSGIAAAISGARAVPYPLGGGATFQCNGKAVALSPNICSAGGLLAEADTSGNLSNYQLVSGGELLSAGN
ncbi:ABC transporter substrate-binding protein [Nocardia sp. NPDC004168]|uniref:ABC transporter substrate-binding protein n=1 Tax=Nocardia sp. NPDC004168 TaxID=3154452 RepID=UPI0033AE875D